MLMQYDADISFISSLFSGEVDAHHDDFFTLILFRGLPQKESLTFLRFIARPPRMVTTALYPPAPSA